VLAVAGGAIGGELVTPGIARVAALAGELGVATAQRKPRRLVVVEADGRPFARRMAGFTGLAVATRVFVLQAVTGDAGGGETRRGLAGVALCAGDFPVAGHRGKRGFVVIEGLHPPPALLAVTAFALFAQPALMPIDRLVAVKAASWRLAVFRG